LVIISQVLRHKNKIWKILETPLNKTNTNKFDDSKRDPLYTFADDFPLHELTILSNHYHPTVQKFTTFIIENYKKETISYEGDPLIDFSLINFLEKFILKNPKIKKDKKHKKIVATKSEAEIEDEEFRRFIGDDVENNEIPDEDGGEKFDFIAKFGEFEKISGKKNKKSKNKNKGKDIDEYADQVIEDEYERYENEHGGDVDEDIDFDEEDI
jgi:ribosome biogenesis protein MAK21